MEINSGVYLLKSKMRQDHVYFGWSWSFYFGLGLGLVSSGLGLSLKNLSAPKSQLSWLNLSHWPMFSTPETSVHVLKKNREISPLWREEGYVERIWRKGEF